MDQLNLYREINNTSNNLVESPNRPKIKKMKKRNNKYIVLVLFIILALIQPVMMGWGNPFCYDWSWPIFDLKQFWDGLIASNSLGLFTSLSQNGPALFGLFGVIHFSPSILFKIFIFLVHFVAGYGFYLFMKSRVRSEAVAIISGLAYTFTPYIFIRTIIGFIWSIVAYAVLPIFFTKLLQPKKKILDFLIIGFLFSLIFGQTQAGLLTLLIITVYMVIGLFTKERFVAVKNYLFTLISLVLFALPWAIAISFKNQKASVVSGFAVTTLERMSSLPHSYRNMLMLSDHEITTSFFYPLSHNILMMAGFTIVWFVALCALLGKKNRQIILALFISSLFVIPFYKGPIGHFGSFYLWFYSHFPQIMIFRETYHFEFLFAISLCVLFAFGLDWLWEQINLLKLKVKNEKLKSALRTGAKTLFAGSAIFIIAPYLTFDYVGYSPVRQIPADYNELYKYFQSNKDVCHKIYYPPGLDFVYFKNDKLPGASNSDSIASSLGVSYVAGGTSILSTPSSEMFYQNELVSQFYEKDDSGEFVSLLNEGEVDCVVVRQDMDTKYDQAMNLKFEKDPMILKKWNQNDWLTMTKSKQGLVEEKKFGTNIFVFKINNQDTSNNDQLNSNFQNSKLEKTGKKASEQFSKADNLQLTTYNLPLTDWANINSFYKNGWSRGRYDFWRKLFFAQLRQDFIYTDKGDSVLTGKIDQKGEYEVWGRYLNGGAAGSWQLVVSSKTQPTADSQLLTIVKDPGEERFVWKKIGDIKLEGQTSIEIKNILGENAIADTVLIKK